jgi:hypothetical protein
MTFQLDTSGVVTLPPTEAAGHDSPAPLAWRNLDPFTQGYVEAALQGEARRETPGAVALHRPVKGWAFSDLAPETLARIIEDCAAFRAAHKTYAITHKLAGREFWEDRQAGSLATFPPLTASLGDDGKVYLQESA